jgi:hypothetical protein
MLLVSQRYRFKIVKIEETIEKLKASLISLHERWTTFKTKFDQSTILKRVPKYKSVKGDQIDEMMGIALTKANINLKVARTSAGKYLFGTKNIMCKIVNGKLVIRVGGGYMGTDEFI